MKAKNYVVIILSLIFLVAQVILVNADIVEKNYQFENYQITDVHGYQIIVFDNTLPTGKAGEPVLSYHSVSILLPPGEIAESIEIIGENEVEIPGNFQIYPQQHSQPISRGRTGKFVKNAEIYKSNEQYPTSLTGKLSTHFMNGFSFALSAFTPMMYYPASGKVKFYKTVTIRIHTKSDVKAHYGLNNLNTSSTILQKVHKFAQNPELISQYPQRKAKDDDYQLLIVTPFQYADNYQTLIDLYYVRGIKTQIATTEDINSTMPGQDLQEKIRNYIIQEYQNHSIEHVLLSGDVELVPYRGFYCVVYSSSTYEDDNIPSDLYYSALDGTWNDDGDNLWGEIGEDDLLPEISVARFTISNITDLNNMLNKTISYQDSPITGELRDPLLAGEHLWSNPLTWGGDYLDLLIGYHEDNGYITDGIPEDQNITKLYDRDMGSWSGSTLISEINEGKSFVHHCGHANTNYCMRLDSYEITNSNFSGVNGIDHNFTMVYTHGCYSGAFDASDCIAEKMVTIENFAVAFVGNSRYGWFNEGQTEGPSAHLHREFVDALYNDKLSRIGSAHSESRTATSPWVNAPGQWEEGALRWCFYCCNVLGDPAMAVWTDEPITVQADYQTSIPVGVPCLEVTVTDNGNPVEGLNCVLFKDDVCNGIGTTDANGIAQINIDPLIVMPGDAEIVISGYNCLPTSFPIIFIPNEGPYVVYSAHQIDDSAGNNNGLVDFGEDIGLSLEMTNVGLEDASNVDVTISSADT
ncbi:MAG: hypothetical protein DRH57_04245, partial [Candidatus Cloacimonadota bacterium]